MPKLVSLAAALTLLLVLDARAQQDDEPREIIRKAVKAMGLDKQKEMPKGMRIKAKGTLEAGGMTLKLDQQVVVRFPNQFKETAEIEVDGKSITIVTGFDGKKGWIEIMGKVKKLDDKTNDIVKEAANMFVIAQLTPLLDKKWELSLVGEVKVDGKSAVGVRVSGKGKGFKDLNLFFDKKSGLMTKVERQAVDPMSGEEFKEERILKSYKDMDGRKIPEKIVILRDGKMFLDAEVTEYAILDAVDPAEFAMPKEE